MLARLVLLALLLAPSPVVAHPTVLGPQTGAHGGGVGAGGTPAGSNTYVQFNSSGSFGADAAFTYDPTTDTLTLGGTGPKLFLTGIGAELIIDQSVLGIMWEGTADLHETRLLVVDPTADRTFYLPDKGTTDTLVGETITQTLTNKTLAAADNVIEADSGDDAGGFFTSGQIERARGGTGADTSSMGVGLFGSNGSNAHVDVDTPAELETALGGADMCVATDSTQTWGSGSAITWTFNAGATDPKIAFGSSSIAFDGDGDGSAECTVDADGLTCTQVETDNNEAGVGGNAMSVLANDTTNPDIGCGDAPSNALSITDADETAADRFDVCAGTTRVGTLGRANISGFASYWNSSITDAATTFGTDCITMFPSPNNTVADCFTSGGSRQEILPIPSGVAGLSQDFTCALDGVTGAGSGDTVTVELVEGTWGGASASVVSTITFTQGGSPALAANTVASDGFDAIAAASTGLGVRLSAVDANTSITALLLSCRFSVVK